MYIEIDSELGAIPQISFKRDRASNVIKQSEFYLYEDAKTLLDSLRERVCEYQSILEHEVLLLIKEKEQALNVHINQLCSEKLESLETKQKQWFTEAEKQLSAVLTEQSQSLQALKSELKSSVVIALKSELMQLNQNEMLIQYLVEILHTQIDDVDHRLKVDTTSSDTGVSLSIEDDEQLICINTSDLVEKLKKSLDVL